MKRLYKRKNETDSGTPRERLAVSVENDTYSGFPVILSAVREYALYLLDIASKVDPSLEGDSEDIAEDIVVKALNTLRESRYFIGKITYDPVGWVDDALLSALEDRAKLNLIRNGRYPHGENYFLFNMDGFIEDDAMKHSCISKLEPKDFLRYVMERYCPYRRGTSEYNDLATSVALSIIKKKLHLSGYGRIYQDEVHFLAMRYIDLYNSHVENGAVITTDIRW